MKLLSGAHSQLSRPADRRLVAPACVGPTRRTRRPRRAVMTAAAAAAAADINGGKQRVVICGGGIVGAATAFYLATQHGLGATVVEREGVAAAASGKAGGFLALDWNDGAVGALARRSYALHEELAERFGSEAIGYRAVDTIQVVGQAGGGRSSSSSSSSSLPGWLDGNISRSSRLGTKQTTAQVHPAKLTRALMAAAEQAAGAQVLLGTVTGIDTASSGAVTGVRVRPQQQPGAAAVQEEQALPADAVVLAMGAWTDAARAWLSTAPPTSGQKYHSIVLRPEQPVTDTCVFTSFRTADRRSIDPELYPRPDATVYVCGEPEAACRAPQGGPAAVSLDPKALQVLKDVSSSLASSLSGAAVEAEQACLLPMSEDGLPVIGKLPGVEGAYVATGHSCWGILNAPATGEALAQLIVTGRATSVDLRAFDPARFVVGHGSTAPRRR